MPHTGVRCQNPRESPPYTLNMPDSMWKTPPYTLNMPDSTWNMPKSTWKMPHTRVRWQNPRERCQIPREICRNLRERRPIHVCDGKIHVKYAEIHVKDPPYTWNMPDSTWKRGVLHWYGLILYSKIEILLKREGQFITQEAGEKKSDETICYKKAFYYLACKFFNLFCRLTLPDPIRPTATSRQ